MKRLSAIAAPFVLLAAAAPAHADIITQTITGLFQDLGDFTPFNIDALPFDASLGTLDSVTVELSGTYVPHTFNDLAPPSGFPATVTLTPRLFVFATNGGPTTDITLTAQTGVPLVLGGTPPNQTGEATGAPTALDETISFSDLSAFVTGVAGSQLLVEYGFRTDNGLPGAGGASDLTSFNGQAVLTYTYDVPEPAALVLLATGLLGLTALRRRMS